MPAMRGQRSATGRAPASLATAASVAGGLARERRRNVARHHHCRVATDDQRTEQRAKRVPLALLPVGAAKREGHAICRDALEADVELARLSADSPARLHRDQADRVRTARDHYDAIFDDVVDDDKLVLSALLHMLARDLLERRQADHRPRWQ